MVEHKKQNLVKLIFWGCLFFTFSYYTFDKLSNGIMPSDFPQHTAGAQQILDNGLLAFLKADAYPLWQLLVILSNILFRMPLTTGATFVCSLLNTSTFIFLYHYFSRYNLKTELLPPIICGLLVMASMYLPWYNSNIHVGMGGPTVWHNPTTVCVRPLALAAFILLTDILNHKHPHKLNRDIITLAILLVFCNLAKPSFEQGIIPGLGLFIILKLIANRGQDLFLYIKIIIAFVPSVLLLVIQWFIGFYNAPNVGENNSIAISLFEIIKLHTPNILISFCLVMGFPLYVAICNWKRIKKKLDLQLLGCSLLASFLEYALLMETGSRKLHGNLGWAWVLFVFLAYIFTMREFLIWNKDYNYEKHLSKITISIGWILFFIQVAIGIYYTFHLFM